MLLSLSPVSHHGIVSGCVGQAHQPHTARGGLQVGLPDARPDSRAPTVLTVPLLLYTRKTDMAVLKSKALPNDLLEYWQDWLTTCCCW